jgi:hypothetical protein
MQLLQPGLAVGLSDADEPLLDFQDTVCVESGCDSPVVLLAIIRQLQLRRRHVADRFQQPAMIEPIDSFQGFRIPRPGDVATGRVDE